MSKTLYEKEQKAKLEAEEAAQPKETKKKRKLFS
jgi:hypothetical protein